jgi:hypothetical protein
MGTTSYLDVGFDNGTRTGVVGGLLTIYKALAELWGPVWTPTFFYSSLIYSDSSGKLDLF